MTIEGTIGRTNDECQLTNVECRIKESSRFYNYQTTERSDFHHLSFFNRHYSFQFSFVIRHSLRLPAESSDPSRAPVKTDGYVCPFDNDRNLAGPLGVFQHGVKMLGLFDHVIIIYLAAFFGKSFTSCPGVRSSIFSEKQNFVGHFFSSVGVDDAGCIKVSIVYNYKDLPKRPYQPASQMSIISN